MSLEISNIKNGLIAGFAGTVGMTAMMMVKKMAGVMPELDPVHMISNMVASKLSIEPNAAIGWVMHWGIGTVLWGGAFAVLNGVLPGKSQVQKGLVLGVIAWLVMMVGPMPMSGSGLFALNIGMPAPIMTLVLHLVYGGILGFVYSKLSSSK